MLTERFFISQPTFLFLRILFLFQVTRTAASWRKPGTELFRLCKAVRSAPQPESSRGRVHQWNTEQCAAVYSSSSSTTTTTTITTRSSASFLFLSAPIISRATTAARIGIEYSWSSRRSSVTRWVCTFRYCYCCTYTAIALPYAVNIGYRYRNRLRHDTDKQKHESVRVRYFIYRSRCSVNICIIKTGMTGDGSQNTSATVRSVPGTMISYIGKIDTIPDASSCTCEWYSLYINLPVKTTPLFDSDMNIERVLYILPHISIWYPTLLRRTIVNRTKYY